MFQLALFPESDVVSLPSKPWPSLPEPLGDSVEAETATAEPSADQPPLFELEER